MLIYVTAVEVRLSPFLPPEEKVANYPPLADAPQLIVECSWQHYYLTNYCAISISYTGLNK